MSSAIGKLLQVIGRGRKYKKATLAATLGVVSVFSTRVLSTTLFPNLGAFPDSSGKFATFSKNGGLDLTNPFFRSLGTNGRTCVTCHQPSEAWTITPPRIQKVFSQTSGKDPLFRTNDGANCPSANVATTTARARAYSLLLSKGLIRVSLPVPTNADFAVTGIREPNVSANGQPCKETTPAQLAMFRRPLPAANLQFLSTVMWDGRESAPAAPTPTPGSMRAALATQAVDATTGHAQAASAPSAQDVEDIVQFELALSTAQTIDNRAGDLARNGGKGGPVNLSNQEFFIGINDPLGGNPKGTAFDPAAFNLFGNWLNLSPTSDQNRARAAIARGEAIFNSRAIAIRGVAGLNDALGKDTLDGTCTTCHDTPNAGNHSVALAIDIGVSKYPPVSSALNLQGLPVYTITCNDGRQVRTTDPGRAMITGRCADLSKTKGPVLRALAPRAPYFHNGAAATLQDVVKFYDDRFNLGLSTQEKSDLVAFLKTL
jgi:cytochrome c peroxidase